MNSLAVLHAPKGLGLSACTFPDAARRDLGWLHFETCQRQIWIHPEGDSTTHPGQMELHRDADAYSFLLEVICGLRSRVFGETEILGQFKEFCRRQPGFSKVWGRLLLEDVKHIRTRFMSGLGSRSYGSVVRRWTSGSQDIVLLGTGQLARKIHPWLEGKQVRVLARSASSPTRVGPWGLAGVWDNALPAHGSLLAGSHVIIAAPVKNAVLETLSAGGAPLAWIDLRSERGSFRAEHTLEDLFRELEKDLACAEERRSIILPAIEERAKSRLDRLWCRPMGWEDLA